MLIVGTGEFLMTKIVGFQSGHDVSYCVLKNGIPMIHEELERFSRKKGQLGDGLQMFYKYFKQDVSDINFFSFGNLGGRSGRWKKECKDFLSDELMRNTCRKNQGKFFELSHHMSHAANAFFSSNFESSLIITIDGGGNELDGGTTACTIYKGYKNKIEKMQVIPIQNLNIGRTWEIITQSLGFSIGFPVGNQAGTLMAMAGMSDCQRYVGPIIDLIEGNYNVENSKVIMGKIFEKDHRIEQVKFDISHSLQFATELKIKEIIQKAINLYPSENLCLSGGCALNSVMIGKIKEWFPKIKYIYIPPIPTDAGLSIGSAQYVWHQILNNPRINWENNFTPYLGRHYYESEIISSIKKYDFCTTKQETTDEEVLDLIANQKIISIFGIGSESGRRALGNRSILADPRSEIMKELINKKVKHRQWFRPFAPSILREEVKNWFERDEDSPYMSTVLKWKTTKSKKVPAVCHFDNSARLQTVTKSDNPWFYKILKKWKNKTNIPILLNTSFNDSEPIVETPEHAIKCLLKTNIDYLYFTQNKTLVKKN